MQKTYNPTQTAVVIPCEGTNYLVETTGHKILRFPNIGAVLVAKKVKRAILGENHYGPLEKYSLVLGSIVTKPKKGDLQKTYVLELLTSTQKPSVLEEVEQTKGLEGKVCFL